MFDALHVPTRATEVPETEDIIRAREQIRDVIDRTNREAPVDSEEVGEAFDEARGTFQLLITGRRASGNDAAL